MWTCRHQARRKQVRYRTLIRDSRDAVIGGAVGVRRRPKAEDCMRWRATCIGVHELACVAFMIVSDTEWA
jgi:hypothetical protein